jgi:mannose-6-phosphate isomerase-like protein (cupin superfamily)
MPTLITGPTRVEAAGNKPKLIDEYFEFTVVLRGTLSVEYAGGRMEIHAGQALIAHAGEWVRYSTPGSEGAEYIAVCLPAFSLATVHRDASNSPG